MDQSMNIWIFYLLLAGFISISLGLGVMYRKAKSKNSFFRGNRHFGVFPLAITMVATQVGGGFMLGSSETAFKSGYVGFFYPLSLTLGLLIVGLGFGARLRQLDVLTLPEIFERIYKSKMLRLFSAAIIFASLFSILIAMGISAKQFLFTIGMTQWWIFPVFWLTYVAYTTLGGFSTVVWTDFLQVLIIAIAFIAVAFHVPHLLWAFDDGFWQSSSTESLPSLIFFPMAYMLIDQTMGQRSFAASTPKQASYAALLASILLAICAWVPVSLGYAARGLIQTQQGTLANPMLALIQSQTSPALFTLFAFAIMAAIISTADSILCSISSNITHDFVGPFSQKLTKPSMLPIIRLCTFVSGILAGILGCMLNDIMQLLIWSYYIAICCLAVPIVMAAFKKHISAKEGYASVVSGFVSLIILQNCQIPYAELIAVAASAMGFGLASLSNYLKGAKSYVSSDQQ